MKASLVGFPLLFLASLAQAQLSFDPVTVHPPNVGLESPFLVLIEDAWADGCGGSVETRVDANTIEIVGTLASPILGRVCTSVITPFKQLVNPRSVAGERVDFADTITINYLVNNGNGPQLRFTRQLSFDESNNQPMRVQTGSWTTSKLGSSGLFIDQQGGTLSAALLDYGVDNLASWYYSAGAVNGNVYIAEMASFGLINCVTTPCPRAAPVDQGSVNVLLRGANEMLVGFEGIAFPSSFLEGNTEAIVYARLDFARSPGLPADDGHGNLLPDLAGDWVGGVGGAGLSADDFRALTIVYAGADETPGLERHTFEAYLTAEASIGNVEPEFLLVCEDLRPVDGAVGCRLEGYRYAQQVCNSFFPYAAVAEERVVADAMCGVTADVIETKFELYRR